MEVADAEASIIVTWNIEVILTGIAEDENESSDIPRVYTLGQNCPNPFSRSTVIGYQLSDNGKRTTENQHVVLKIYNITGRLVRTLVDEPQKPGYYKAIWDRKDNSSKTVSSGIYFYKLKANKFTASKKLILLQ